MYSLLVLVILVVLAGLVIMYNARILEILANSRIKSSTLFYRLFGRRMKALNLRVERISNLKKDSLTYKMNVRLKEIISNLGMAKDNVTPAGVIVFILSLAFALSVIFSFWAGSIMMLIPSMVVMAYLLFVLFNYISIMNYEKKESEIMDAEDLIAMDVSGGVYNSILRYKDALHPSIRPYFEEFVDNVQQKGYGFRSAMILLSDKLGVTFYDFAQKAIMFEEKADSSMVDIFSSVVEQNSRKRTLRYKNAKKFNKMRMEFMLSVAVITVYGVFSIMNDSFMRNLFLNTLFGKILLLVDVLIVAWVLLAYLSMIKTKLL